MEPCYRYTMGPRVMPGLRFPQPRERVFFNLRPHPASPQKSVLGLWPALLIFGDPPDEQQAKAISFYAKWADISMALVIPTTRSMDRLYRINGKDWQWFNHSQS